jgi:ABC-type glycerol-3-phosphate transport system substrate-binding protein
MDEGVLMRESTKRLISILLILGMLLSFSACQKGKNMWDPYGEESTAAVSASPSGSASGETVTEVVDERPYFSGRAVSVYEFSEEVPWLASSVIELGDNIGVFLNSYSGEETNLLSVLDYDGNLLGEIDLSDLFEAGDYYLGLIGDPEGNIHFFMAESGLGSTKEIVVDSTGQIIEPRHDSVWNYNNGCVIDDQGNTYTISSGSNETQITVYDSEGTMTSFFEVDYENEEGIQGSLYELDNTIYISSYDSLYPIDFENETLGEPILLDVGRISQPLFLEQGIYFDQSDGLYKFDMTTQETRKIMSWSDMNIDITEHSIEKWIPVSDEKIIGIGLMSERVALSSGSYGAVEMVILNKEDINPNLNKEVLTIGGFNIGWGGDLLAAVNQFNFQSTEYRIEIRDYVEGIDTSEFEGEDYYQLLYSQAAEQLNLDILSGDAPDMLCSSSENSYFPIERFETQGLLLDLYELAAGDETFHKEDYVQSVLSLLEVDGKLYRFPMSFSMGGLIGPTRLIGDRSDWTVEEFNDFASGLPEGTVAFPNIEKEYLMEYCLSSSMSSYVDYHEGTVSFDTPEFCELLEFVKTYGCEEIDWDTADINGINDPEGYINENELIEQGKLGVDVGGMSNVAGMANNQFHYQEPVTYIGYPSSNRSGMVCSVSDALSICADCENPEAAWSFIRFCMSEETQNKNFMFGGTPIHQGVLEEKTTKILNQPMTDAASWNMMTEVTQTDVDAYYELLDSISALYGQDTEITDIVNEEAQAYYQGAKTAEEVAAIIQNRVSTFVSEVS